MDIIKIEKDVVDGQFVVLENIAKLYTKNVFGKDALLKLQKKINVDLEWKMIIINKNSVVNLQEDVVEINVMIITQNANGLVKLLQQNITGNVLWLKLVKVLKKKDVVDK